VATPDHHEMAAFHTLAGIRPPRVLRSIGIFMGFLLVAAVLFLLLVRWVQTAAGTGSVIALNPQDRVQSINALVGGRIDRWYVQDGARVKQGDPIVRIVDNDPQLLDRLQAERAQVDAQIDAARNAARLAQFDVTRTETLFREGLAARRDMELARIKLAEMEGKIAEAVALRTRIDVNLSRQSAQTVSAPRDGIILRINAGDTATAVSQGDALATFAPSNATPVVELYIDGRDVPMIHPGRAVRLEFEGWPAIQFSGWPAVAQGMFDGRVRSIDPAAGTDGLFRILVEEDPAKPAWPQEPYVRLGTQVRGWVLMNEVSVGFELWRLLNDFPLQMTPPPGPGTGAMQASAPGGKAAANGGTGSGGK
jgi:multidrug resistance efflux pump